MHSAVARINLKTNFMHVEGDVKCLMFLSGVTCVKERGEKKKGVSLQNMKKSDMTLE